MLINVRLLSALKKDLNMSVVNKLAREELLTMVPYQSARRLFSSYGASSENKLWLNANEAPGEGCYQLSSENINRYPDFQPPNACRA